MRRWIASLLLPLALAAGLAAQNLGQAGAGQAEYLGQGPHLGQADQAPRLAALAWPAGDTATALARRAPDIYPLDTIATPAAAAYGTQRLRAGWSGALLRAQRDSDNAQQDIGATATGELDTIALLNWLGVPPRPLDVLSVPPAAAYGLRLLRTAYAGAPLIQVRRSSDNALRDIGATAAGLLDTTALTNFTGSASAFVAVWYDQTGFGRHATQATPAAQPRIVNAGVVETLNGRPAINFLAANSTHFAFTGPQTGTTDIIIALQGRAAALNQTIIGNFQNDTYLPIATSGNVGTNVFRVNGANDPPGMSGFSSGTPITATRNGYFQAMATSGGSIIRITNVPVSANVINNIGKTGAVFYLDGHMSELVLSSGPLTTNDVALLERSQAAFFSIAYATALPNAGVASWYDQSGNGRHAAQATAAAQPRIVSAGVVETENVRPCLAFNGSTSWLASPFSSPIIGAFTGVSVQRSNDAGGAFRALYAVNAASGTRPMLFAYQTASSSFGMGLSGGYPSSDGNIGLSPNATSLQVFRGAWTSTGSSWTTQNTINGNSSPQMVAASGVWTLPNATSFIGRSNTGEFWSGKACAIIWYSSLLPPADGSAIDRSQGARFGIAVAAIGGSSRFAANDNIPVPANDDWPAPALATVTRNRP
jgi:hypothetical protein